MREPVPVTERELSDLTTLAPIFSTMSTNPISPWIDRQYHFLKQHLRLPSRISCRRNPPIIQYSLMCHSAARRCAQTDRGRLYRPVRKIPRFLSSRGITFREITRPFHISDRYLCAISRFFFRRTNMQPIPFFFEKRLGNLRERNRWIRTLHLREANGSVFSQDAGH